VFLLPPIQIPLSPAFSIIKYFTKRFDPDIVIPLEVEPEFRDFLKSNLG
jgi:hypothetical protein